MIKRGHYQSKASLNSEKPEIIRVLGPNKRKDGYYKVQGDQDKSEFEIENEYVFLETSGVDKVIPKTNIYDFNPEDIVIDAGQKLETIDNDDSFILGISGADTHEIDKTLIAPEISSHMQLTANGNTISGLLLEVQKNQKQILAELAQLNELSGPSKIKNPELTKLNATLDNTLDTTSEIVDIIERINIQKLEEQEIKKSGNITPKLNPRPTSINIEILVPVDYDLTKVLSLVEIFEYSEEQIVDVIVRQTLSNPEKMNILINHIVTAISNQLIKTKSNHQNETNTYYNFTDNNSSNIAGDNFDDTELPVRTVGSLAEADSISEYQNLPDSIPVKPQTPDIDELTSGINSISDFLNKF